MREGVEDGSLHSFDDGKVLGLADGAADDFDDGMLDGFLEGSYEDSDYGDSYICADGDDIISSKGVSDKIPICSNDGLDIDKHDRTLEDACEGRKDGSLCSFTDEMSLGSDDVKLDSCLDDGNEGMLVHSSMELGRVNNIIYSLPLLFSSSS